MQDEIKRLQEKLAQLEQLIVTEKSINIGQVTGKEVVVGSKITVAEQAPQARIPLQRPPRAEHFVGRKEEIEGLIGELQPKRIVTRCGPGGIGKSALVAEVLWQLAPDDEPPPAFPDGIVFYSFYNQPQAELALEHIARSFGEEIGQGTRRDAARRALAKRQALLVLDGAEEADDLTAVVVECGTCGVLITSRRHKDAMSSRVKDVIPLPISQAVTLLQAWGGKRATDKQVVRQICHLVGGLPLAICLVGRYLAQQQENATDYLAWLQETPLVALDQGERQVESVPLVIERSLKQVSQDALQALAVVGVLAKARLLRQVVAAALALPEHKAGRLLGELVNYSLLKRPNEHYRVSHALIHTYAHLRLTVTNSVMERLSTFYETFVNEQADWIKLDGERANIMALLNKLDEQELWETVLRLAKAIESHLRIRGYKNDHFTVTYLGIKAADVLKAQKDQVMFRHRLGKNISPRLAEVEQLNLVLNLHIKAGGIAVQNNDYKGVAEAQGHLGIIYRQLGLIGQAIRWLQMAIAISRQAGAFANQAKFLCELGKTFSDYHQMMAALACVKQALTIATEINDQVGRANYLNALGQLYHSLGLPQLGFQYYGQALSISLSIGDRKSEANAFCHIGQAFCDLGDLDSAHGVLGKALGLGFEIADSEIISRVMAQIGHVYVKEEKIDSAVVQYRYAWRKVRKIGHDVSASTYLSNLTKAYLALGKAGEATKFCQQQLDSAREAHNLYGQAHALHLLAVIHEEEGKIERSIACYEQAISLIQQVGHPLWGSGWLMNLGNRYGTLNQPEKAIGCYKRSLDIAQLFGYREREVANLANIGQTYRELGEYEQAKAYLKQALILANEINSPMIEPVGRLVSELARLYQEKSEKGSW